MPHGTIRYAPDDYPLIKCAFTLNVVNKLLCDSYEWTEEEIKRWQLYLFNFGAQISDLFQVEVNAKMHRVMRHVHHHLVHIGCIRRGSSEENEMAHKQFKSVYKGTNKHMDFISAQLLTSSVRISSHPSPSSCLSDIKW